MDGVTMLHRFLFETGCFLKYPGLIPKYHLFEKTQWLPYEELLLKQEQALAQMVTFCYENVPYYTQQFAQLGLLPQDIMKVQDLEKLPVLNKQIVKANWDSFIPRNLKNIRYLSRATSGSTGTPFKYRISIEDWETSLAMMFRDRGHGGYKPGDRIAYLSCRIPPPGQDGMTKARNFIANQKSFYFINVDRQSALKNFKRLNDYKPLFLVGGPLPCSKVSRAPSTSRPP